MKNSLNFSALIITLSLSQTAAYAVTSLSGLTEEAAGYSQSPVITIGYLMQLFLSLIVVFGLIYLTSKYVLPKFQVKSTGRLIEVIDRVGLEPQVSAYILKVRKKSWLVVASAKNVQLIDEIEESDQA